MDSATDPCVSRYREIKNTKVVAAELGIPQSTVYWRLRRAGVSVTGDPARYGSDASKTGARGERWFQRVVPWAVDQNQLSFQPKYDFMVSGLRVDVKTSRPRLTKTGVITWVWSLRKQIGVVDYFVCLALTNPSESAGVHKALLIPGGPTGGTSGLHLSHDGIALRGKWARTARSSAELRQFFQEQVPQ